MIYDIPIMGFLWIPMYPCIHALISGNLKSGPCLQLPIRQQTIQPTQLQGRCRWPEGSTASRLSPMG